MLRQNLLKKFITIKYSIGGISENIFVYVCNLIQFRIMYLIFSYIKKPRAKNG